MAKLTNVAVLDMVNGEITKVAYEGAEYAKVDSNALIGDLALCVNETPFFTVGEFYLAWDLYETGEPRMKDDADDNYRMRQGTYVLFRKISAQSKPTLEQVAKRVETLESDVAALKSSDSSLKGEKKASNSEFKEGSKVKVLGISKYGRDFIGHTGVIDRPRKPCGCWSVDIDGNDFICLYTPNDIELIETIEFEGATYRKVDREAREGDVVIARESNGSVFKNNVPYEVIKLGDNGPETKHYVVYRKSYNRTRETVDVYEPIEQAKYVPQEGDIVVITANTNRSANKVDDIGKVTKVVQGKRTFRVQTPNGKNISNWTEPTEVRKATPAEVEKYEQAVHKASFAVGDYVKVVKSYRNLEGNIAKITKIGEFRGDHGDAEFEIEHLTGEYADKTLVATADQIVKATDAEIAEALKPKLKAGDYVKFSENQMGITAGKLYEVCKEHGELSLTDDDGDWRHGGVFSDEHEILSAEEAKWEKIGRKPNEFKKGDVVRFIRAVDEHKLGSMRTIKNPNNDGYYDVQFEEENGYGSGYANKRNFVLVSPVESLFK